MNVPTRMMGVTTTRVRITVPGTPVLTIPGILPGIMAVTMVAATMVVVIMVVVTMVVAATTAVVITTLAESDLGPGDGELPTDDAIPGLGPGGGAGWKAIRKETNPADDPLIEEAGNIGAVGEAGEMMDTEEA